MNALDLLFVTIPLTFLFIAWREQRQYRRQQAHIRQRFIREIDGYRFAPGPRPSAASHLSPEERRARATLYGSARKIEVAPINPPIESARVADTTGRPAQERHVSHEQP